MLVLGAQSIRSVLSFLLTAFLTLGSFFFDSIFPPISEDSGPAPPSALQSDLFVSLEAFI